jgi:hypothetical protein
MFDIQRGDFAPYQQLGQDALPSYYKMLGITPSVSAEHQSVLDDYSRWQSGQQGGVSAGGGAPSSGTTSSTAPSGLSEFGLDVGAGFIPGQMKVLGGRYIGREAPKGPEGAEFSDSLLPGYHENPRWAENQSFMSGDDGYDENVQRYVKYAGAGGAGGAGGSGGSQWGGDWDMLSRAQSAERAAQAGGEGAGAAPELSPLAQWQMQEFNKQQNRQDAARGLSGSGGASARLGEGAMQIAGADYQNSYSRILDALKIGQGAAGSAGASSGQYSTQIGQAGARQQQNILNQGQSNANLWSGLGQLPGQAMSAYQNAQGPATTYQPSSAQPSSAVVKEGWGAYI